MGEARRANTQPKRSFKIGVLCTAGQATTSSKLNALGLHLGEEEGAIRVQHHNWWTVHNVESEAKHEISVLSNDSATVNRVDCFFFLGQKTKASCQYQIARKYIAFSQ